MKIKEEFTQDEWAKVRSASDADVSNSMFLLDWMSDADGSGASLKINLRAAVEKASAWKNSPLKWSL